MTTSSHSDPTGDPATDSAVQRILSVARRYWPEALLATSVVFTAATILDPMTAAGAFPDAVQSAVDLVGGETVILAAQGLLSKLRQGPPVQDGAIAAELRRTITPEAMARVAAGENKAILRQIGRMAVLQQQIKGLLEADYDTGRQVLLVWEQADVKLDRILDEMATAAGLREGFAELRAEIEKLRLELGRSTMPIPQQRPPTVPHFTGRAAELAELRARVRPGRIVTVLGPGGMGKTSLAAEFVASLSEADMAAAFPGGLVFYSFDDDNDVQRCAAQIAKSCGLEPLPHPLDAAAVALGREPLLLILDRAEAADNLPKLLARRGRCGVLITSRARRDVHDDVIELIELDEAQAVALLQAWGGPRAADGAAARAIVERLGYLPLAVTLAGGYLQESQTDADEYLAWLRATPLEALDHGHRRGRSVPLLLDKSLAEVGETAREVVAVLGALALAPIGVEPVAAALAQPAAALRQPLAELVGYSLLRRDGGYRLVHALLHEYARERLAVAPAALARLAEYYNQFARVHREEGPPGYRLLDAQRAHIMALLPRLKAAALWIELNDLVWAVHEYMDVAGHTLDLLEALRYGVTAARALDSDFDLASHLIHYGNACINSSCLPKAKNSFVEALALSRKIADQRIESNALGSLGIASFLLAEYSEAITCFESALIIHRALADRSAEASDLSNLGMVYLELGYYSTAIVHYKKSLKISKELEDRRAEASGLGNLASAYAHLDRLERSIVYHKKALVISREIGDRRGESNTLGNLGTVYFKCKDFSHSLDCLTQALDISREISDRRAEGKQLGSMGNTYFGLNQPHKAIECHSKALEISREVYDQNSEAIHLVNLGNVQYSTGLVLEAINNYLKALDISRTIGDRHSESRRLAKLISVYSELGLVENALKFYDEAIEVWTETAEYSTLVKCLTSLGDAYCALLERNAAIGLAENALYILEPDDPIMADQVRRLLVKWRGEPPPSVK
jgi:tetratricopeptide (TPR) repeat protein